MSFKKSIVYLVDDEYVIRDSLALLITATGQAVKAYESASGFLSGYEPERPGCLLLDVRMPEMGGLELQEELIKRDINIPIIFISGHAEITDSAKAFRAGAVDFLEKPFDTEVLLERIKEAIARDIDNRERQIWKREVQNRLSQLTEREQQVLRLIVSSHSNKESAKILNISNRTIDAHRARIMEKLRADNLADLIVIAMECDLLKTGTQ